MMAFGKASASLGRLTKRFWNERGVCLSTTINVYCAVVLTTLLYGCEAWTPYRRHIRRLDQFYMRCLRHIAGIKWQDMVPNTEVLELCGTWGIEFHIKRAQLRRSGHLVRMTDDRIPKALFYGQLKIGNPAPSLLRHGKRQRQIALSGVTLATYDFEQKRLQIIKDRRTKRKNGEPPQGPATTYDYTICGRRCASPIGLHSHQRKHK